MSKSQKRKSFAVGAVVGGVLGAVSALLLAPKSGRELRKDIADGYDVVAERTQQIAGDVAAKTKEIASGVSDKTQGIARTVGSHTSEWYGKAADLVGIVSDEVKTWRSGRSDLPELEPSGADDEIVTAASLSDAEQTAVK